MFPMMGGGMMPYPVYMHGGGGGRRYYRKSYKKKVSKATRRAAKQGRKTYRARRAFIKQYPRGGTESLQRWGESWAAADPMQRWNRRLAGFYGKGDYATVGKIGLRALGAIGGGIVGMVTGGPSGALRGAMTGLNVGGTISKAIGWGDYACPTDGVVTNSLIHAGGGAASSSRPVVVEDALVNPSVNADEFVFSRNEFVRNITVTATAAGNTPFTMTSLALNPGLETVFPWLSAVAQNFTYWKPLGIIFHFKPTTSDYGATGANQLGNVYAACNYDPEAIPFLTSQQMLNYAGSNSCKPSEHMMFGVECDPSKRSVEELYVRATANPPGPAPSGQKGKTFTDLGLFQIATEGIPVSAAGTFVIGQLFVRYKIKLSQPSITTNLRDTQSLAQTISITTTNAYAAPQITFNVVNNSTPSLQGSVQAVTLDTFAASATQLVYFFPLGVTSGTYLIQWESSNATPGNAPESLTGRHVWVSSVLRTALAGGGPVLLNTSDAGRMPLSTANFPGGVRGASLATGWGPQTTSANTGSFYVNLDQTPVSNPFSAAQPFAGGPPTPQDPAAVGIRFNDAFTAGSRLVLTITQVNQDIFRTDGFF